MDESVIRELEKPQVGTLKLSDAIRRGAKIRPQCKRSYFNFIRGETCALGAALEATGHNPESFNGCGLVVVAERLGITFERAAEITIRNDNNWTREQIADWLESQGL